MRCHDRTNSRVQVQKLNCSIRLKIGAAQTYTSTIIFLYLNSIYMYADLYLTCWDLIEFKAAMTFDICVVGAGMVGSAAAKWLSLDHGTKVCLIGPQEPTDEEYRTGKREIFGSHYDEGRITRELDTNYTWGLLAQRSIQRYRDIEKESGMQFYKEVGCIFIDKKVSQNQDDYLKTAMKLGACFETFDATEFHSRYPNLKISKECQCIWTPDNSGYISPRNLVAAQQKIAKSHGCEIFHEVVVDVKEESEEGREEHVKVVTESGREVLAKRVLLCTGAFTNYHRLLPDHQKIDLSASKVLVVKAEVTEEDALKLANMPTISLENECCYMLPPILYPDGKYYIKIGLWSTREDAIGDLNEAARWFCSRGQNYHTVQDTIDVLQGFIPELKPIALITDCCSVSHTPTQQLYCDMLTARTGALVGMNGWGAKSSDEIGRMGASMIAKGAWDYDLPAEHFKIQFKKDAL